MLFPIRDSIAPRITPVVNIGLIVACSVAFVYELVLGSDVEGLFFAAAFIPARLFGSLPAAAGIPDYGIADNLVTILLSMFLHGGWLHIIGNMWFLWVFGENVGQMTNYDRLIIEVWTGGTMRPQEALSQSARILVQHFSLVAGVTEEIRMEEIAQSTSAIPQEIYETPIEQLDLSVRVFNSLKRTGIINVGEVLEMLGRGDEAMLSIRNFGAKSLTELREKLIAKNLLKPGDLPESNLPEEEEEGEE